MNRKRKHEKIRLAFVGGAINSAVGRAHFVSSQMDGMFQLVAGCFSRNKNINIESGYVYGVPENRIYFSLEDLIHDEKNNIDAIVILTPQDQHINQLEKCVTKGIPVICEKALVSNLDEVVLLRDLYRKYGGFLRVTYNYTGYPIVREIREIIRKGILGKIQQVKIEMPQEGFLKKNVDGNPVVPQNWRLYDGSIPTISLDLGIHVHHLVDFLIQEKPIKLVAHAANYGNFKGIVDNINVLANYTNDVFVNIWYSKTALGNRNGLKFYIYGERGAVEWQQERPEIFYLYKDTGERSILDRGNAGIFCANDVVYSRFKVGHPAGYIEAFANYYCDIAKDLFAFWEDKKDRKGPYVFGLDESIEGLVFLSSVSRSIAEGKWVKVPENVLSLDDYL